MTKNKTKSLFTCIKNKCHLHKDSMQNKTLQKQKQTLSAPPLAEEEVPEGSGAGGEAVLSKSSSAPVEKARQFDMEWYVVVVVVVCVGGGVAPTDPNKVLAGGTLSSCLGYLLFQLACGPTSGFAQLFKEANAPKICDQIQSLTRYFSSIERAIFMMVTCILLT